MHAEHLSNYLEITPHPPGNHPRIEIGGRWLSLKVKPELWPRALREQWQMELSFLFPSAGKIGRLDLKDRLTLCHQVTNCPRKACGNEDRACENYNQGICVVATTMANELRPLSFGTIGAFNGVSKQRVQQIYCAAQKKVIRAAARDPVLREYYTFLGLRPENLPDPRQLASKMEAVLFKK